LNQSKHQNSTIQVTRFFLIDRTLVGPSIKYSKKNGVIKKKKLMLTQVAKNHLSFATAFFHIFEPDKGRKGPENHSLG
jgi:hypothetical protein